MLEARLWRDARIGSTTILDRGQSAPWGCQQNGPMRHLQAADHRGNERDPVGRAQRRQRKSLAGQLGCAQAAHGGGSRTGQQDGADVLGYDDERREFQNGVIPVGKDRENGMAARLGQGDRPTE